MAKDSIDISLRLVRCQNIMRFTIGTSKALSHMPVTFNRALVTNVSWMTRSLIEPFCYMSKYRTDPNNQLSLINWSMKCYFIFVYKMSLKRQPVLASTIILVIVIDQPEEDYIWSIYCWKLFILLSRSILNIKIKLTSKHDKSILSIKYSIRMICHWVIKRKPLSDNYFVWHHASYHKFFFEFMQIPMHYMNYLKSLDNGYVLELMHNIDLWMVSRKRTQIYKYNIMISFLKIEWFRRIL